MIPYRQERYQYAIRRLNRALRTIEGIDGAEARAQRARLFAWCAGVRQYQHRAEEAVNWCWQAITEAEQTGARDALAQAYFILDWAYLKLGRLEDAVYSPRAIEIYEEMGDLDRLASVLINTGLLAHVGGRWDEAIELQERARQALEKIGDRASASVAAFNIAEVLIEQGRIDEAESLFQDVSRVFKAAGNVRGIALTMSELGRIAAWRGRFDEARALLEEARALHEEERDEVEVLTDDARLSESLALEGESAAALELATDALRRAEETEGASVVAAQLHRVRGWALMQMGELEGAYEALDESLREAQLRDVNFGQRSSDYELVLTLDALVRLAQLRHQPSEELETEREALIGRLGVVAMPTPPLAHASVA